ncbi:MAG: tyrosine-type recombinase/integrase [Candidatus Thermoplasmatota archaeon]
MRLPNPKNEIIDSYLLNCRSKATVHTYQTAIWKYFKFFNTTPEKYLKQKRDFNKDLKDFNDSIQNKSPLTIHQTIIAVNKFLSYHKINIDIQTLTSIKAGNRRPLIATEDVCPTNQEIRQILSHGQLLDKALFTLMATSGLRINEATHINWDDIDLEGRKIHIRASIAKKEEKRDTFFTEEARDLLLEWKKEMPRFFEQSKRVTEKFRNEKKQDKRVFPVSTSYMQIRFANLVEATGHPVNKKDPETGRYLIHTHSLRKFFASRLEYNKMPEAIVQKLLGHRGYCNGSYTKISLQEMKETYDKFSNCLSVFSTLEVLQPQIKKQDDTIKILQEENQLLKLKVMRLENQEQNLETLVQQKVQEMISQVMNFTK